MAPPRIERTTTQGASDSEAATQPGAGRSPSSSASGLNRSKSWILAGAAIMESPSGSSSRRRSSGHAGWSAAGTPAARPRGGARARPQRRCRANRRTRAAADRKRAGRMLVRAGPTGPGRRSGGRSGSGGACRSEHGWAVEEECREQDGEVGERSEELVTGPPLGPAGAQALNSERQEERSGSDRGDQIDPSADAERDEHQ